MRAKTTLKSLPKDPKTETTIDPKTIDPRVLVSVERWQLQQVYDLLYSIELIIEHWGQSHDEEAVDIVYMLRPHVNQFSSLFDSDGEEPNLWSVLRDSKPGSEPAQD